MVKIYANSFSSPCNKVRYACQVIGVDYEWIHIDFARGEHKSPEHIARHPAGKVPVIDDDGFVLFESDAICRYLSTKYGGNLVPEDLEQQAIVNQWNAFSTQHIGLAMGKVLFNRVIAQMFDIPVDENSLREGLEWLNDRYLPLVDQRLGQSRHLGGEELSLADLTLLSILDPAEKGDVQLNSFGSLNDWRSNLQAQEFWTRAWAEPAEV